MPEAARPPPEDYPDPSAEDLRTAIRAVLEDDDDWRRHQVGRYTAHQTYTVTDNDVMPAEKELVVRVKECNRDWVLEVPVEKAAQLLEVLG